MIQRQPNGYIDYSQYFDDIDELLQIYHQNQSKSARALLERYPELREYTNEDKLRKTIAYNINKGKVGREKLLLTKEELNKNGEVVKSIHSRRAVHEVDTSNMTIKKVTRLSHGGSNIQYENRVNYEEIYAKLREQLAEIKIPKIRRKKANYTKHCAIVNIYDAHLDKLPVRPNEGIGSLDENIERLNTRFDDIINDIRIKAPKMILFPIGSDLFHTNWFNNKTKKGTELEYYCNPEIAYAQICEWMVQKILQLSALTSSLVIVPIKGNHDQDKVVTLKVWMEIIFKGHKNITVENEIPLRQRVAYRYGRNLIGFGHGDKAKKMISKIPLLLSIEYAQEWADSEIRHFYCGDLHHEFEYKFLANQDQLGCKVEFLRSAGVDDQYHVDHGWIGVPKTMYVDFWPFKSGRKLRIEYEI